MKNWLILITIFVLALSACAVSTPEIVSEDLVQGETDELIISEEPAADPNVDAQQETITALSDTDLSDSEIAGLLFMREEEKLARDVYLQMYDVWNFNIFTNITRSEQSHMDAVLVLINDVGAEDPVGDAERGVFENQDLQDLYDQLIDQGVQSQAQALLVGGAIEEIDILDLQTYLSETTNSAVIAVYENLLFGSINHLQAFVRTYERQTGETYEPQYLSQEAFEEMMADSAAMGGGGSRGMNASSQGKGQN